MALPKLTPHPCLLLPDRAQMDQFIAAQGKEAFAQWINTREERIRQAKEDPFRYGFKPPIWDLVDDLLCDGKEVRIDLHSMYQGAYAYDYDYAWLQHVDETVKRRIADFPKEIITTGARNLTIIGDNRSGKTEKASQYFIDTLMGGPDRMGWALHTSAKTSIDVQQKRIYGYLPLELRAAKEKRAVGGRKITKLGFSDADGFSNGVMVLPNASKGRFLYYGMKLEDVEGNELDIAWADELIPVAWVNAIRTRLTDRNGVFLLTFTPVKGYTETVADICDGATDLAKVPMRFFPHEDKPKVQRTRRGGHVLYFHALHDNPFTNREPWLREFGNESRKDMRRRGEGIAEQAFGVQFPIFNREVHVIDPSHIPAKGTNYQFTDPGDGKPWCNFWLRVAPNGKRYIYREWPCEKIYIPGWGYIGAWATREPDTDESKPRADGYPGEGQEPLNWGIKRYAEEFARLESGEHLDGLIDCPGAHGGHRIGGGKGSDPVAEFIFERQMDSRARSRKIASAGDEGTSLVELCEDHDLYFEPASGRKIDNGIDLVSDWLDYDVNRPVEPMTNEPGLYISEECANLIWALEHWTGKDGQRGACKDWIDLLRYAAEADPVNIPERESRSTGGGYY